MSNKQESRKSVGVWIDHREAVLVFVSGTDYDVVRVSSHVEKQLRREGTSPLDERFESHNVPADDSRERRHVGHLSHFYDDVIGRIADTAAILICGPGEAKGELRKQLEKSGLAGRTVNVEAAERMTERQMVALTRDRFPAQPDAGSGIQHH